MTTIKLAAASLNQIPLDWDANKKRILNAISEARKDKISLLCFQELVVSAYGCEDMFLSRGLYREAYKNVLEIVEQTSNIVIALGCPISFEGNNYNGVFLIANKKIIGGYAKHVLADGGVYYEQRWFEPWPLGKRAELDLGEVKVPFGDYVYDIGGLKIGFEICEDAWTNYRTAEHYKNIDLILNPSASHFAFLKFEKRKEIVTDSSKRFNTAYLYANAVGNESGRLIFDAGSLFAEKGKLHTPGERFSYSEILIKPWNFSFDIPLTNEKSLKIKSQKFEILRAEFLFTETPEIREKAEAKWEGDKELKCQEFTRAVALGLYDYLRKSHSKGFVVSLSGGADSSAVACLCAIMLKLSGDSRKLSDILCCVYLKTENSSQETLKAASELAKELGAEFQIYEISDLVKLYTEKVSKELALELTWEKHDVTLQNIQARARSPLVWMLANLKGFLLLATSNRSEAAVGYTTMDGDTSGGLSPIGGIDKAFLRNWLKWLEKGGLEELGEIKALSFVNKLEPSAELRPLGNLQTDEKDLMPYEVLDAIERLAIRDKLLEEEVLEKLILTGKENREVLAAWVSKFFRLWKANQWKRERYAPCFHLDDENLDPKTWCRYPILSV